MRILFAPDCPTVQDYSIVAMIQYLGYSVAKDITESFDVGYLWQDATFVSPPEELRVIAKNRPVLNFHCNDISKVKVDSIWKAVSGNSALIEAQTYVGKVIKKFNANGQGGGQIIECPDQNIDVSSDVVYQRYLDTCSQGAQLEYRVPYVMGEIPMVFEVLKDDPEKVPQKKIRNQYKHSITPRTSDDVFTQSEQAMIHEFCQKMGFDIGELDVLRCKHTGEIYVIDVNTTPTYFNMFNRYWRPQDKRWAIACVAQSWERQLEKLLSNK